jgi:hypothetical protein
MDADNSMRIIYAKKTTRTLADGTSETEEISLSVPSYMFADDIDDGDGGDDDGDFNLDPKPDGGLTMDGIKDRLESLVS